MRDRQRRRLKQSAAAVEQSPVLEPRLPSELHQQMGHASIEFGRRALMKRQWRQAFEFGEAGLQVAPAQAHAVMAEAAAREARRCALKGQFGPAKAWAKRARDLRPHVHSYQERLRLVRRAADAVLRREDAKFFPDTVGPTGGEWWQYDVLGPVRGWNGSKETVRAPAMLEQTTRSQLEDVYALGIYQPWHVKGPTPLFTRYIKELKNDANTIALAAILLRAGLAEETDWLEEIDVIVPVPTGLASYERRGVELTEELAAEVAMRLCIPLADVFERDPDAAPTHTRGGYRQRVEALLKEIRLKKTSLALLENAEAVLLVDDVVTYGSTFEACALKLAEVYGRSRVYGAALAYTETPQRRERAEREQTQAATAGGE